MNKRLADRTGLDLIGWAGVVMAVGGFVLAVIAHLWK
jgi:hypothetical protein